MITSETSDFVAAQATKPISIPRNSILLLGVFGPEANMKALVRLPGGRIQTVEAGKSLHGGTVRAIDENGLILQKNNKLQRLYLP